MSVGVSSHHLRGVDAAHLLCLHAALVVQATFLHIKGKSGLKHTTQLLQCWASRPDLPTLTGEGCVSLAVQGLVCIVHLTNALCSPLKAAQQVTGFLLLQAFLAPLYGAQCAVAAAVSPQHSLCCRLLLVVAVVGRFSWPEVEASVSANNIVFYPSVSTNPDDGHSLHESGRLMAAFAPALNIMPVVGRLATVVSGSWLGDNLRQAAVGR